MVRHHKRKKKEKLNVVDHVKLSTFLSISILFTFKIIVKLYYLER